MAHQDFKGLDESLTPSFFFEALAQSVIDSSAESA